MVKGETQKGANWVDRLIETYRSGKDLELKRFQGQRNRNEDEGVRVQCWEGQESEERDVGDGEGHEGRGDKKSGKQLWSSHFADLA